MPNSSRLNLLIILQLIIYFNLINPLIVLSQEAETIGNVNSELPCLDTTNPCVEQLTQQAIANSLTLQTLNERITLIDERLALMGDRKEYAESRLWTNYLPASTSTSSILDVISPFAWIRNLAGGGDMQRDRLAIADLEVKAATLEAARAELERQREEEKVNLEDKVLRLVLDYEAVSRKYDLVESQLKTYNQQQEIMRIRYRLGEGETAEFLESQVKGEGLRGQLTELESLQQEKVRELGQLIGDDSFNSNQLSVILTFHGISDSRVMFENQKTTFFGSFPFHQPSP